MCYLKRKRYRVEYYPEITGLFYALGLLLLLLSYNKTRSSAILIFIIWSFCSVALCVYWFYSMTGSHLDLDSTDSILYEEFARSFRHNSKGAIDGYLTDGYGYSDFGALILPTISYLLTDSWWLSRVVNYLMLWHSVFMFFKLYPKYWKWTLVFFINPLTIYYAASGLKEVFMLYLIVAWIKTSRRGFILHNIVLLFLESFRSLFGVIIKFVTLRFKYKYAVILIIIPYALSLLPGNYIYLLKYVLGNPDFIFDRTPVLSFFALFTGPIPLFQSIDNPFNCVTFLGQIVMSMFVINWWMKFQKYGEDRNIVLIFMVLLLLSGTLWKIRYWLPIYLLIYNMIINRNIVLKKWTVMVPIILFTASLAML